jgi:hypothetical protein
LQAATVRLDGVDAAAADEQEYRSDTSRRAPTLKRQCSRFEKKKKKKLCHFENSVLSLSPTPC